MSLSPASYLRLGLNSSQLWSTVDLLFALVSFVKARHSRARAAVGEICSLAEHGFYLSCTSWAPAAGMKRGRASFCALGQEA